MKEVKERIVAKKSIFKTFYFLRVFFANFASLRVKIDTVPFSGVEIGLMRKLLHKNLQKLIK
ncbi:MAG: hypothetical protein K940chlam7_00208 [Chlamydiae bacterium]|nr:hypothetical protein [Chlamydiota bacterium]